MFAWPPALAAICPRRGRLGRGGCAACLTGEGFPHPVAGAEDPGDRMGDQKHGDAIHHADGLPAFFAALDPVLPDQAERICKDMRCLFESDAVMLSLVGTVLGFVPVKRIFIAIL